MAAGACGGTGGGVYESEGPCGGCDAEGETTTGGVYDGLEVGPVCRGGSPPPTSPAGGGGGGVYEEKRCTARAAPGCAGSWGPPPCPWERPCCTTGCGGMPCGWCRPGCCCLPWCCCCWTACWCCCCCCCGCCCGGAACCGGTPGCWRGGCVACCGEPGCGMPKPCGGMLCVILPCGDMHCGDMPCCGTPCWATPCCATACADRAWGDMPCGGPPCWGAPCCGGGCCTSGASSASLPAGTSCRLALCGLAGRRGRPSFCWIFFLYFVMICVGTSLPSFTNPAAISRARACSLATFIASSREYTLCWSLKDILLSLGMTWRALVPMSCPSYSALASVSSM
mmetsp:Transcript_5181/g.16348  ORF Transcript_5181/g.16348 Transcript_5181/m.16348 type:complete len:339 (-) Transcript_5181:320-1336(-)